MAENWVAGTARISKVIMTIDAHAHIFPEIRGRIASGTVIGLGFGRAAAGKKELQVLPPFCENTEFGSQALITHMDWAGVDKAVLLQGPFYGEWNQYVLGAVQEYPDRLIAAAYCDPWEEGSRQRLKTTLASRRFRAVKLECSEATGFCSIHPKAKLDASDISWLWDLLDERGLVLVLDLGAVGSRSYQTAAVRAIAKDYPEMKIVISHLAQLRPEVEADSKLMELWLEQIDLGRLPNVWFDCSAIPGYLPQEDYPFPSVGRYLKMAIERIGSDKVMWGTDVPGLLTRVTYLQLVKMARLHTQFLTPKEQAMFWGDNALRIYFQ